MRSAGNSLRLSTYPRFRSCAPRRPRGAYHHHSRCRAAKSRCGAGVMAYIGVTRFRVGQTGCHSISEGFNMPWEVLDRGRICRQDFHSARDAKILPGSASELSYSSVNKVSIILLYWLCNDISLQRARRRLFGEPSSGTRPERPEVRCVAQTSSRASVFSPETRWT